MIDQSREHCRGSPAGHVRPSLVERPAHAVVINQARRRNADAIKEAGDRLAARLSESGFENVPVETLGLRPPAVCVLAIQPGGS